MDDYIGQRFGRLVVISEAEPLINRQGKKLRRFHCQCDCGSTKAVQIYSLRYGQTKSCGCLRRERFKQMAENRQLLEKTLPTLIQTKETKKSTQIDAFFESKPKIDAFLKIDANVLRQEYKMAS